jgi:hypothetical protein
VRRSCGQDVRVRASLVELAQLALAEAAWVSKVKPPTGRALAPATGLAVVPLSVGRHTCRTPRPYSLLRRCDLSLW